MNICCHCEKTNAVLNCSKCKYFYCSKECQKNDWKTHKNICSKHIFINSSNVRNCLTYSNLRSHAEFHPRIVIDDYYVGFFSDFLVPVFEKNIKCQNIWIKYILENNIISVNICNEMKKFINICDVLNITSFKEINLNCDNCCNFDKREMLNWLLDKKIEQIRFRFCEDYFETKFRLLLKLSNKTNIKKILLDLSVYSNVHRLTDEDFLNILNLEPKFKCYTNYDLYSQVKKFKKLTIKTLLLMGRKFDKNCYFYYENFPIDVFKKIFFDKN